MEDKFRGTPIAYTLCTGREEIVDLFIGITVADSVDKIRGELLLCCQEGL